MLALIPARGGSKRLPGKNIVNFRGKPIIAYTIEAAFKTGLFERVIVSTEDVRVQEVAAQYGAEINQRHPELAKDTARVVDVCTNLLKHEADKGRNYDILCCLYSTAPLRNAEDIMKTVDLVKDGQCDFAMAVTEYYFPPHQALKKNALSFLEPMWPEVVHFQSQSMPDMLVDNGSTYAVSVPAFLKTGSFFGTRLKGYLMPRARSVDIDVKEDLELADLYAERLGY